MKDSQAVVIRAMRRSDLLALDQIDPAFESDTVLDVERLQDGASYVFRLTERALPVPFVKETGYRYDLQQLEQTRYRLEQAPPGQALLLVAEAGSRLVAVLEVEAEPWRNTALIWALFIDRAWRNRGLGRNLLERAEAWAIASEHRAVVLETQSNNVPAIRFYQRHGYHIAGLDIHFYTNHDIERREVALFMYKTLPEIPI
jgi:ribosomal protein S18 acetylase RimI-like enzyme